MKLGKLYELCVYCEGNRTFRMAGEFSVLERAYVEWRDSTFDDNSKFTVDGFSDDAKHTPARLTLSRSIIEGMLLVEL